MVSPYIQIPPLVLKARHLSGSSFCISIIIGMPEQALGLFPLDVGLVVDDEPSELFRTYMQ